MNRLSITVDSSEARTTLCDLCARFGTDKSPYTPGGGHRHPYTTPYSLFFEPLRNKPIKFAEFGVFRGASVIAWRHFFPRARIFGFDNDEANLNKIKAVNIPGVWLDMTDCAKADVLEATFQQYTTDGELFDVIIDDAAHNEEHQAIMIKTALRYMKQGGLLIIEDVFRDRPEEPYLKAMEVVKDLISFQTFIICDHKDRFSPGWNNDKMLVIVRA